MMDVDSLTDEELFNQLRVYRPDVGPVVDSTRSLYRSLLRKALQGILTPTSSQEQVSIQARKSPRRKTTQLVAETPDDTFEILGGDIPEKEAQEWLENHPQEWVQNDPNEVASVKFSFFFKCVFYGVLVSFFAIVYINYLVKQQNQS